MRLIRVLVALVVVALGAAVGALNRQVVVLDLGFTGIAASLGVMLLSALLLGALCGGLALALGVVIPLRRRLRDARPADRQGPLPPQDTGV
ncbi:uncharacterized protein DUF1049 [Luteimonas sp. J16]|jgi:putative membrane protein|uniref:lipopolysaccharide assembly protein LapA domain-containing protein n=1 Tax=unclassified Luteimonas TaxID=2629088 RepID=UPI0004AF0D62|nr:MULTISPECIES: lipopolysaccharide assembly protein LapA domain-containing protein [unclassified Luteimonas]TWG92538.1 uncharacterized protein DUF1049 [Luteimonas sp. J16]